MEPGVIMATQNFKINLFLNLDREGKIYNRSLSPPAADFLHLETPGLPACYPLIVVRQLEEETGVQHDSG